MKAETQTRILTALRQTTARIPHIAADHGVSSEQVRQIAKLAGVRTEHRV